MRAAAAADAVLAEEAVLMVEALADAALSTTIATAAADADNIRQQTTISKEARDKAMSGVGNDRDAVVAVVTMATATTAVAAATQRWQRQ